MKGKYFISSASLVCMLFLGACSGSVQEESTISNLTAYSRRDLEETPKVQGKQYAAYFDFSGIYYAFNDEGPKSTFNGITQKITSKIDDFEIFSLANDSIVQLDVKAGASSTDIYNKLHDSNNTGTFYAPIEKSLKSIINNNKSAVLVTDFEEYTTDNVIQRMAYAAPYFKEWIKKGNDITFFVTNYTEPTRSGDIEKHLYYAVFDNSSHELLNMIEDGLEGRDNNYKKYTLSSSAFTLTTDYLAANKGGCYHDENGEDIVSSTIESGQDVDFFAKIEGFDAEFYPFGAGTWANIKSNADAMMEAGVSVQFEHLLSRLYADFSNNDSYNISSLAVSVKNIDDDFRKFSGWKWALSHKPNMIKDGGVEIAELTKENELYYDGKGQILSDWDWASKPGNITEVKDLLVFDQELFEEGMKKTNGKKVELAINFDSKFTGALIGASDNDMLQVDLYISEVKPNYSKLEELFKWQGNDCLYDAVLNTLQESKPLNKVIYTYFLRVY